MSRLRREVISPIQVYRRLTADVRGENCVCSNAAGLCEQLGQLLQQLLPMHCPSARVLAVALGGLYKIAQNQTQRNLRPGLFGETKETSRSTPHTPFVAHSMVTPEIIQAHKKNKEWRKCRRQSDVNKTDQHIGFDRSISAQQRAGGIDSSRQSIETDEYIHTVYRKNINQLRHRYCIDDCAAVRLKFAPKHDSENGFMYRSITVGATPAVHTASCRGCCHECAEVTRDSLAGGHTTLHSFFRKTPPSYISTYPTTRNTCTSKYY